MPSETITTAESLASLNEAQQLLAAIHVHGHLPAVKTLIERLQDQEPIGAGYRKVVYDYKPGQVVAINFYQRDRGEYFRREFYTRKLAHSLLPECIPDVHFASANPRLMIMDKADNYSFYEDESDEKIAKSETRNRLEALGFGIDGAFHNFHISASGTAVYIDDVWDQSQRINREVMEGAMKDLPADRRAQAGHYLGRLNKLGEVT